ncbi:hypothetical protein COCC4DRAFT_132373, partial [Bipolaris maydis ATCC 48331]
SSILKQFTGGLVVRWETTGEYPLSYVFFFAHGGVHVTCTMLGTYLESRRKSTLEHRMSIACLSQETVGFGSLS